MYINNVIIRFPHFCHKISIKNTNIEQNSRLIHLSKNNQTLKHSSQNPKKNFCSFFLAKK